MADPQQVARQFLDAFNAHDENRIRALNSERAVFEAPGDVQLNGREAAAQYAMAWLNAFPDAQMTIRNELVSGSWVVQEFSFTGTHRATLSTPGGAIAATNKPLNGRGTQILRVDGDTIAETRLYFDQVQVMTQLGLMPSPPRAAAG
jgi:predicted ester cyclase